MVIIIVCSCWFIVRFETFVLPRASFLYNSVFFATGYHKFHWTTNVIPLTFYSLLKTPTIFYGL